MKKVVILVSLLILSLSMGISASSGSVTIEEQIDSEGYKAIEVRDGRAYEIDNDSRTKLGQRRSTLKVLQLPLVITDKIYEEPEDVKGIVEDIPFNFFATLEQSSEFIYSLFNQGFRVISYKATSLSIQMEITNGTVKYRIIVYENYLKVYAPKVGGRG